MKCEYEQIGPYYSCKRCKHAGPEPVDRECPASSSIGLGDTVAKITKAVGIDKLVGDDCGCDKRQKKLNELFPYK